MKKSILDKKKIRERLSNLRASFDNKTLNTCSLNAQLNLLEFLKKKKFQNIGFFISFNSEVSTHFLLSKLKKKIVPKIFGRELIDMSEKEDQTDTSALMIADIFQSPAEVHFFDTYFLCL